MGLEAGLNPALTVVTLRAPYRYQGGGFAWFDIVWDENGVKANGPEALSSRDHLIEVLRGLPGSLGIEPSKFILGGFSQGAMMSLGVALLVPEMLDGVVIMSGAVVPEFVGDSVPEAIKGVKFLVQHGTIDPVVTVDRGREVCSFLQLAGCEVSNFEYPFAHQINEESLEDLNIWLDEVMLGLPVS